MSEQDFKIGDKVTAIYKTGKYIGEITDIRPAAYLVKVLAVMKHPMQGDLHNPKQTEVSMFHQRRALAFREQTNVPKNMVRGFEEEIPEYKESLREAVEKMKHTLSEANTEWNDKSLQLLEDLAADYFK
ncbi:kinase-associated lipoprotein B [Peribacillus simplex]|uniref:kinase-associated lipoprotein B n=1 Tax=Peribacillus TaxID=2675229 RepID=UPI000B645273|nr:kinase-associated lipoprotein B [Peribacillus simplex]MDF9759079.1 kinase-associated protein B [Peribacillus simplex]MDM5292676.1 kinase-associated lipoprotein B [Peribacillus simplex]SNS74214.1 kinase-associated protein B [Bacillus sp. OK838]